MDLAVKRIIMRRLPEAIRQVNQGGVLAQYSGNRFFI